MTGTTTRARRSTQPGALPAAENGGQPERSAAERILVAEDSQTQGKWLRGVLAQLGYEVELVVDGATALQRIREEPPAVVLADVDMPGLDGFELCRRIKADPTLRLIPFLMVTHRDRVTDLIQALEVGADNYVTKPLDAMSVVNRVGRILTDVGQWRQRGALQRHRLGIPPEEIILSLERGQLVEMLMGAAQKLEGELATVAEIGLRVTMIDQLDELLALLVRRTRELSGAVLATAFMLEDDAWSVGAVDAIESGLADAMPRWPAGDHLAPTLLRRLGQRRSVHLKHDRATSHEDSLAVVGVAESYAYPMLVGDRLVGALMLSFDERRKLAGDEQRRYQVLANHGAVAVLNAQNLEAERRLHRELAASLRAEKEAHKNAMFMLAAAVEARDGLTGSHLRRVQCYAEAIGRELNLDEEQLEELSYSSVMHDVGKLLVPDEILGKAGKLSDEEWVEMRRHPEYGAQILGDRDFFRMARSIALCHHERWDGTGYPRGLKGDEIPMAARITSVADVFDALTTARPYKEAWTDDASLDELRTLAGRSFDPQVVEVFLGLYASGEIARIREQISGRQRHLIDVPAR